eukprot:1158975-Pelagomonas_calceolata.AAC.17
MQEELQELMAAGCLSPTACEGPPPCACLSLKKVPSEELHPACLIAAAHPDATVSNGVLKKTASIRRKPP